MKYLFTACITVLLFVSCKKETEKEEEEKVIDRSKAEWLSYKLEGNVKTVSEKSYISTPDGQKERSRHENSSEHDFDLTFDENGLLVLEKKWFNNGEPYEEITYSGKNKKLQVIQFSGNAPISKTLYNWDSDNNNTTIIKSNPDNTSQDKTEMLYDENGRLAEKNTYSMHGIPTGKITYSYDAYGNLAEEVIYMNAEILIAKNISEYNQDNKKTAEIRYDKNGNIIYKTVYKYEGENLIEKETRNGKGKVEYSEKITYDEKGNELTHYTFDSFDNTKTEDSYKYDAKGNKIRWEITKNKKPYMNAGYRYDDHNNLVEVIVNDANNKVIENKLYEFQYDNQGNWIRKVIYSDGIPKFIIERKITYFDN